jgi:hypothetical protein
VPVSGVDYAYYDTPEPAGTESSLELSGVEGPADRPPNEDLEAQSPSDVNAGFESTRSSE